MRYLVVVAIAAGCTGDRTGGNGGWVFTADVNASRANGPTDFSGSVVFTTSANGVSLHGNGGDANGCAHFISFDVPAPLTVQTYQLGGEGGPRAGYTDCAWNNFVIYTDGTHGGQLTVTRADGSCAEPPCIDATFGFIVSAPVAPHPELDFTVSNGHVSNY